MWRPSHVLLMLRRLLRSYSWSCDGHDGCGYGRSCANACAGRCGAKGCEHLLSRRADGGLAPVVGAQVRQVLDPYAEEIQAHDGGVIKPVSAEWPTTLHHELAFLHEWAYKHARATAIRGNATCQASMRWQQRTILMGSNN